MDPCTRRYRAGMAPARLRAAGRPSTTRTGVAVPRRAAGIGLGVLLLSGCAAGAVAPDDAALLAETSAVPRTPPGVPDGALSGAASSASGGAAEAMTAPDDGDTPDVHSETGELVPGFPVDLLPVPDDAMILVTSAVPVGDAAEVQEVSLNLRTSAGVTELLTMYRDALLAGGFTEVPPVTPQADLAAESVFVRSGGDELVSIGVLDTDGLRTVAIGGRIRTDAGQT